MHYGNAFKRVSAARYTIIILSTILLLNTYTYLSHKLACKAFIVYKACVGIIFVVRTSCMLLYVISTLLFCIVLFTDIPQVLRYYFMSVECSVKVDFFSDFLFFILLVISNNPCSIFPT